MGIRVIKSAIACVVAAAIAEWLGLESYLSAGLLAILCVDVTIKRGLRSAMERFFATVLGLFFGSLLFFLIGFHIYVLGLFVLFAYPVLARFRLKDGIVTSTVIVLHVFAEGNVAFGTIGNEILLLLIGLSTATVFNLLYMPRADRDMARLRTELEEAFSAIFKEIARYLRDASHIWSGREILAADDAIRRGIELARKSAENRLFNEENSWLVYFQMRKQHMESIQRMLDLVAQVHVTLPQGQYTADLFENLSVDVKNEFYTGIVEAKLEELQLLFKAMSLPATREEFEIRSALLQLCLELKQYLSIAKREKRKKEEEGRFKKFLSP